ncbi:NAD(P)/FAD-dependent oxidoreductase [Georgenia sp. H159]|uniref:NAD(P)/FAD-dependent oxidoreductase n=1 Tax=Georgenia sp. H159 TaxID=3076115 RepID=UPI002D790B8F|nr:FAD-dependent oxidoreductase [Georgenia sp. H159]
MDDVVIVGGGQAGVQVADSLRAGGFTGAVTIVADESVAPYQRPPLSKDYMLPDGQPTPLPLRGDRFYSESGVTLRSGVAATGIDRRSRTVHLADGSELGYGALVLATGARNRGLSVPGIELGGIHGLRTLTDAETLREELGRVRRVVVVGAGFIGLEFAAAARAHDLQVTVLEGAPRPMGRVLSSAMSEYFVHAHAALGTDLRLSEGIEHFEGDDGRVTAAWSTTGARYPADLVLIGIGVVPNVELAVDAGLEVDNGIVVDDRLRTQDPAIYAIGDCAAFPSVDADARVRLEAVQNATDQGRHVAKVLVGHDSPYTDPPWFWSNQGPYRLQIAGLTAPDVLTVTRGDQATGKFSVFSFHADRLVAVESVNQPADHMAARRVLQKRLPVTVGQVQDPEFDLKAYSKQETPAG